MPNSKEHPVLTSSLFLHSFSPPASVELPKKSAEVAACFLSAFHFHFIEENTARELKPRHLCCFTGLGRVLVLRFQEGPAGTDFAFRAWQVMWGSSCFLDCAQEEARGFQNEGFLYLLTVLGKQREMEAESEMTETTTVYI